MKKLLATAAVFALMAGSAQAADLALRRAPAAAPAAYVMPFSWSGFYIGAHIGYGWGDGDASFLGVPLAAPFDNVDTNGVFGGLQLGANWQMGSFVLGAEIDASIADINGSVTGFGVTASSQIDWLGTARLRAGVALDRALLYVTGGLAWAHNEVNLTGPVVGSSDETHVGWTLGGGLEYAFSGNWSAKIEYLYIDLGSENYFSALVPPGVDFDAQIHTVKFGINYRFGGNAPVVGAAY
jgi:outer membrane immunogenic protein